ncbi:hypothetical protein JTB14_008042 [Gonioctena quinquepunctata]|nr:hypothetical protein JTB14_008042 [Gonioctena quinquepunctata]
MLEYLDLLDEQSETNTRVISNIEEAFNEDIRNHTLGTLCEEDINECESNPCQNNGTCLDAQNGYTCNCLPGYSGIYCEIDIAVCNATNETRCLNGGMCQEGPGETFTCLCQSGWNGFLCEIEIDECASAPCQNGAVCIDLLADYSCACLFGYRPDCEEVMQICVQNSCNNGALCLIEEGRSICYCVPDFHGDLCQFQYDECQLGPRCMNGGTCIDGIDDSTCSCPPSLTGVQCECLILSNNTLDCTYVSPKPIPTYSYDNVTIPKGTFTISPSSSPTIQVPTTEMFNETIISTIFTSTEAVYPLTSTIYSTEHTPTEVIKDTIASMTSTSTEVYTFKTDIFTFTPSPASTTSADKEVSNNVTSSTIETSTGTFSSEYSPSTILSTFLPTELTTGIGDTTIMSTTLIDIESNRTFPEYGSTFISSFFTTEPTKKMEASTFMSTVATTLETTTVTVTEEGTTAGSIDCTKKAAFNGHSYLSHRLLSTFRLSIEFEAKTMANDGLLFFSNIDSPHMTLYIEGGYLKFKFSCGYQTMLLSELKIPVNNGYRMNIKAGLDFSQNFQQCNASIKVNDSLSMTGDQIAKIYQFPHPSAWLHLGGLPADLSNEASLPVGGFVGCMSNLKVCSSLDIRKYRIVDR